jgi:transposase
VETGVQVVERWAPLRNRTFFSINEINQAIAPLREEINRREMRHLQKSRRELFEELDRPALKPLPERAFELAKWKRAKVGIDYHVEYEGHYYSVPYQLIHKDVKVRATEDVVEVFYKGKRVSSHRRDETKGHHSTHREHMPESHQKYLEWSPERFIRWAEKAGLILIIQFTFFSVVSHSYPDLPIYLACCALVNMSCMRLVNGAKFSFGTFIILCHFRITRLIISTLLMYSSTCSLRMPTVCSANVTES